jgi:RNA ligase (TIGR02306 family)
MKKLIELIEGYDLTYILGVTQYVAPDPAVMGGDAAGTLQSVGLLISDEERIENLSSKYEKLKQFVYVKSEKLEGTSFTAYIKNDKFGVCGRTVDFRVPDDEIPYDELNSYWKTAIFMGLEARMKEAKLNNFAIQGEMVGEGIQGNIYKLKGQTVRFYNAFDIEKQEYMEITKFIELIKWMGLETVPILDMNYVLPETAKEILEEADKTTTVFGNNPNQLIEGFVFVAKGPVPANLRITRADFQRLSFKAKSRTYDINKNK